jgi:hypothetical protein
VLPLAVALSLVAAAGPAGDLASATSASVVATASAGFRQLELPPWALVATPPRAGPGAPACSGDVCQPRVSVPGFEPRVSMRGRRTDLALALLDRARVEPLATVVWVMAATGLRFDYTPAVFDEGAGLSTGHGGWGHLQVLLRWRLDAESAPVWPVRHR